MVRTMFFSHLIVVLVLAPMILAGTIEDSTPKKEESPEVPKEEKLAAKLDEAPDELVPLPTASQAEPLETVSRKDDQSKPILTLHVEALARKLEYHFRGENLDDEISVADCKAAFDEFKTWDRKTHDEKVTNGSLNMAINYLDDFLHLHLLRFPEHLHAEGFVEKLENTYKRMRYTYIFPKSIREFPTGEDILPLIDALLGQGEQPVTEDLVLDAQIELESFLDYLFELTGERDIYEEENLDKVEELNQLWLTTEVLTLNRKIWPLVKEEKNRVRLQEEDQSFAKELCDVFQRELSKFSSRKRTAHSLAPDLPSARRIRCREQA